MKTWIGTVTSSHCNDLIHALQCEFPTVYLSCDRRIETEPTDEVSVYCVGGLLIPSVDLMRVFVKGYVSLLKANLQRKEYIDRERAVRRNTMKRYATDPSGDHKDYAIGYLDGMEYTLRVETQSEAVLPLISI